MSKKKLRNRLDTLLANLEQEATFSPISGDQSLPGWTWEADEGGCYSFCSAEVEGILGIRSHEFTGQNIAEFALSAESAAQVRAALEKGEFPAQLHVQYQCQNQDPVAADMTIFVSFYDDDGKPAGFRGFVQLALQATTRPADRRPPKAVQRVTGEPTRQVLEVEPKLPPEAKPAVKPAAAEPEAGIPQPEAPVAIRPAEEPGEPEASAPLVEPIIPPAPALPEVAWAPAVAQVPGPTPSQPAALPQKVVARPAGETTPAAISLPIQLEERGPGWLEILDDNPNRQWNEDELRLAEQISDQLSLALENAHLFQAEQRRASELNTLVELSRLVSQNLNLEEVYSIAHRIIGQLMPTESFTINLLDKENNTFIGAYIVDKGLRQPVSNFPANAGFSGYVAQTKQGYVNSDLDTMPTPFARSQTPGSVDRVRSAIAVPLLFSDEVIGAMTAQSYQANVFSEYDLKLLQTFADHIAIAVQNARLYQQEQRRRQVADALRDIARVVGSTLDLQEVINRLLDELSKLIDFNTASIQLIEQGQRQLIGGRGFQLEAAQQGSKALWRPIAEDPLVLEIVETRRPVLISDTYTDPRWEVRPETSHVRSWITAPLLIGQEVVGLLTLDNARPGAYNQETIDLASAVGAQASIAIQNARLFRQTQNTLAETESLYLASAELNTARSYNDILDAIRRHTVAGEDSHLVSLCFFDQPWNNDRLPGRVDVLAGWTSDPDSLHQPDYNLAEYPSLAKLLRPDSPLLIEDLQKDFRLDENARSLYVDRLQVRSAFFISIVAAGQWIGFLNANFPQPRAFSEGEIRRLSALVNQAAVAIQNLRNIELAERRAREAQERSEELALINRVVSAVVSSPDLRQVLDTMAGELITVFNLDHAGISLLNEDKTKLTVVSERSRVPGPSAVGAVIQAKGTATEALLQRRKPTVLRDLDKNPLLAPIFELIQDRDIHSMVTIPIITSGEVVGLVGLELEAKDRELAKGQLTLAETLVAQISTAIQNANLFNQIQSALSETERLYKASGEMNAVASYDDIMRILRSATILGYSSANHVFITLFDQPWVGEAVPEGMSSIARWSSSSLSAASQVSYSLKTWTTAAQMLKPDAPVYIANLENDPRLDHAARSVYIDNLGARSLLTLPLNVGGRWIGQIIGAYSSAIDFTEAESRRLMAMAGQAAVAVQNLRLLEETRRRAAQLETAAEIARDTSGTLALQTLLNRAVNMIRSRYGYYHATIFLVDEAGLNAVVRESTGEAGEEMKRRAHRLPVGSRSIIGYVTETGKSLLINDVTQDPIHRPNPLLPDTRAELGLPLKIGNRVIGALDVQATQVNGFSEDDIRILQTLADQIAVAVDNARSYELAQQAIQETRQRVQELSILFNVSNSLSNASMDPMEIANILVRRFVELVNVTECAVLAITPENNDEIQVLADLARPKDPLKGLEYSATGLVGQVFPLEQYQLTSRVIWDIQPKVIQVSDPKTSSEEMEYMRSHELVTLGIIPLAVKGEAIGTVELRTYDVQRNFTSEQLNLMLILANAAAVALDNARLYEQERQNSEKLREVDKLKSQFLANMSHELRTPLNSIIGFSRVIIKGIDGPTTELQQQDLGAIYSAGQHLLNLINNILDISKIEAGKMELAFDDNVNLGDLLKSVISTALGLVKDKPVKLESRIAPDLPPVRADVTRIRQVALNLISNASKFTEQGSITIDASTQIGPDGYPEVIIRFIDTGIGIAQEDMKKLFQQFSQVDDSPTRRTGGTGLGLSITRLLVEMHKGRIGVESEVGKGSTFWFTLPLPHPEPAPEAEQTSELPDQGGSRLVLAIDDERPILNLYERYLSEHGYQVVCLADPTQAVDRAREVKPFAITLDVMMPNRNGWQVLEDLKNDPATKGIPVIICSILEDQEKGMSLGATGYLPKPIMEDDLIKAVDRLNGDGIIRNILVVDDDDADLHLVERILLKGGKYQVELSRGGAEALAALRAKQPNAVILDLFMPEMDGFTLLENMRKEPSLREIPVVIFTSGDLTEDQRKRLAEFSQDLLLKSAFQEDEMLASIDKALSHFKKS